MICDVVVIGGGQTGLCAAYFLRRAGLSYVVLDAEEAPGGAWRHAWDSLRLFSPAGWSSIAGWPMPQKSEPYPSRNDVIEYLSQYEQRYRIPVERPVFVERVELSDQGFKVLARDGRVWNARAVLSATGTWRKPFVPDYPGLDTYTGLQLHSAEYRSPQRFTGKRVGIVGGGNSAAQILAEIAPLADATWMTSDPPAYLPDDVDGRVLYERATERWRAHQEGREPDLSIAGDIVMVAPVKVARERGFFVSRPAPARFTAGGVEWNDGSSKALDAVVWCTGFKPALDHLRALRIVNEEGFVAMDGTRFRSADVAGLWLLGYGDWAGVASATLIGVTRSAREVVQQIREYVAASSPHGPKTGSKWPG